MQYVRLIQRFSQPAFRIDFLSAAVVLTFLLFWHGRVTGGVSANAALSLLLLLALYLAYGSLFQKLIAPLFTGVPGLPFQLLTGYLVFNSLLFIVALASPMGMLANLAMLSATVVFGLFVLRHRVVRAPPPASTAEWAGFLAIIISCIGATIWANDAQTPILENGNVIFKVWNDVYIHVREISVFAQAHGIGSIQDIKLAGGKSPIYHFGSYVSPAAISALSGATAMQVFASLQLPFGIFLTGIAAYCFMGKLFGIGPGVAAVVAIVLLPDAYQQGFQNRYLSYNFMAQVNLGMLYGIACIAMAWMFMIDGCRRGKIGTVLLAYVFLALCMFYKAHLFVANSYILLIFPIIFLTAIGFTWRIAIGILATVVFLLVVKWSQTIPRIPVLRLDGSGIGSYIMTLLDTYERGWLQAQFARVFLQEKHSFPVQALYAALMLLLSTFGLWLAGLAWTVTKARRIMPWAVLLFPIIVIGNYLIMAMGLALNNREVGELEELLNRPLVWAYFVVAAWTAAVAYLLVIGEGRPKGKALPLATITLILCFFITLHIAPNLQTNPRFAGASSFAKTTSVPACLVNAAAYLRTHSPVTNVVQDGSLDAHLISTSLSERQTYVSDAVFGGRSDVQVQRIVTVKAAEQFTNPAQVEKFFIERGIDWYLQHPAFPVAWPQSPLLEPVFVCGGYKLFHFARAVTAPSLGMPATKLPNQGS